MRIQAFLPESPMFTVKRAALHFDRIAVEAFAADELGSMECLVLAAIFFEAPRPIKPSHLAETFSTTRGNVSHAISSLEAKGLVQRKIDPSDVRAYPLHSTFPLSGECCYFASGWQFADRPRSLDPLPATR